MSLLSFLFHPFLIDAPGKCPVFIDPNCDLDMCARRLLLGKCANAGQTCVAPDYVIVPKAFQETLVEALKDVCVFLKYLLSHRKKIHSCNTLDTRDSIRSQRHPLLQERLLAWCLGRRLDEFRSC